MDTKTIGRYALLAGVVLALIGAFTNLADINDFALPILGLVAGFLYLSTDDATGFYILAIAVAVAAGSGSLGFAGETVDGYVTDWMGGSSAVLNGGALALILRTFYGWVTG
jgi:hypothetical protein